MTAHTVITEHLDIWTSAHKTRSSAGRGSSNKLDLYGIKKLRELILELAVRGKLVPQDPNDEPASELLKKIAAEKARLVKEGKFKKEKPLPKISDEETSFDIPSSWQWMRLPDVYYSISPSLNKLKNSLILETGDIPVVDQGQSFISGYTNEKSLIIKIPNPVIIFGDHTTNLKYVDFDFIAGADGTKILSPIVVFERYFYAYLKSYKLENRGYARHFKVLNDNLIALPPLQEQHRIVAKVDELMAFCDQLEQTQSDNIAAHAQLVEALLDTLTNSSDHNELQSNWQRIAAHFDTLFTTEHSIEQLKQTILQLAVMGKLVPQNPNDEPARELLKKIAAEKAQLIKEGKIKKEKPLPEITDEEKPFELPSGWQYVRFGSFSNEIATGPFGSMIHQSDYIENGVPLINPSHMINGKIIEDKTITVSLKKAKELSSYLISDGDIVMARRGEMGRCAEVTLREQDWLCGTGSFVLKFHKQLSRPFISLIFNTQWVKNYLSGESVGTTMTNLNHGILNKMPLLVPPLTEQHRIVAKVNELMALCDSLKTKIQNAQTTQLALADALVEQAVG